MRSLFGVHQNRESEKKPPLAVQLKTRTVTATSADDVSRAIKMLPMAETVISHRKTSSPKSKYKNSPHLRSRRRFVFLARRKKTRGRARGEKEKRHPLPFACSLARALIWTKINGSCYADQHARDVWKRHTAETGRTTIKGSFRARAKISGAWLLDKYRSGEYIRLEFPLNIETSPVLSKSLFNYEPFGRSFANSKETT